MSLKLVSTDVHLTQPPTEWALTHGGEATNEAIDQAVIASLDAVRDVGEPDLMVELIDLYLGDAPRWIEAIHTAAAGSDRTGLQRAAHTLKGSSGSMGVRKVAETCATLERLDLAGPPAEIERLLLLLNSEFATARDALAAERTRRLA